MNCRSLPSQMASSTGLSTPPGRLPAASVRRWMNSRTDSWPTALVLTLGAAAGKSVPLRRWLDRAALGCAGAPGCPDLPPPGDMVRPDQVGRRALSLHQDRGTGPHGLRQVRASSWTDRYE